MQYAECLKKYYNAVDGTFYDAIKSGHQQRCTIVRVLAMKQKLLKKEDAS